MRDFTGFRFGLVHSEDLHLIIVSSSNRYVKETQPGIKDYTTEVSGGNGSYLFGQTFSTQEFTINVAFEEVDENTWRRISQLFSTDKPQDLVFDELPYKTYRAKLKQKPSFKTLCFTDSETGKRVYKGEGTLNFICYYPFAFGFNKYVVRAADFYNIYTPEQIINGETKNISGKYVNPKIKKHYNVEGNMGRPWKGGYPSIGQVQNGELYFNNPQTGEKEIIDTRKYFSNVPEWEDSAKLLYTPTLDFDQELIFMPQFSQTNYYNMDMGLNRDNGAFGSRLLVYNPGDVPIDFELKLGHLVSKYRANLKDKSYKFRVNRYNVQRLTIEQAVDWCDLHTFKREYDKDYKYGNRYFCVIEGQKTNPPYNKDIDERPDWKDFITGTYRERMDGDEIPYGEWNYAPIYRMLGKDHPKHAYYVEPIPREKLGYFIRLFYWQSGHIDDPLGYLKPINWKEGKEIADRYEELYDLCITEEEQYELYWKTLKEAILDKYDEVNNHICLGHFSDMGEVGIPSEEETDQFVEEHNMAFLGHDNIFNEYHIDRHDNDSEIKMEDYYYDSYQYKRFFHDYIYYPPEYIVEPDNGIDYGKFNFNISHIPSYYTYDYLEINNNDFDKIMTCECDTELCKNDDVNHSTIKPLYLDSGKRMLYNENSPEWNGKEYDEKGERIDEVNNFYDFEPTKKIFNDNIEKGNWFKIPPGWSLIEIVPVIKESVIGGKRWIDAEPFTWGSNNHAFRTHYDNVYREAIIDYVIQQCPMEVLRHPFDDNEGYKGHAYDVDAIRAYLEEQELYTLENYINFNKWLGYYSQYSIPNGAAGIIGKDVAARYNGKNPFFYNVWQANRDTILNVHFEIQNKRMCDIERGFLKLLNDYWRANTPDKNGMPSGSVHDWWWYANSYNWANFPPVYWAFADLLNEAEIKYIPLFY